MKIGNVETKNNVFLAPMAGITVLPFRLICPENGAGLVYSEMVSSKALLYGDEKTKLLLNTCEKERPLAVQIFGSDEEAISYAAKYVSSFADIVDINMGCPAPKVVKNGDGSRLLLDLEKVEKIVRAAVSSSLVPVTVKMRTGWDQENIVAVEAAKIVERAGASAITIHGRTRSQYYSGQADWNIIKEVKKSVKIPVIGNGDLRSTADIKKAFDTTGVDAVMIGRAAFGNPWIFRENYTPSNEERLATILKHLELEIKEKGEFIAIREMRKHIAANTKKLPNSSAFRSEINILDSEKDVEKCLKEYFKTL